VSKNKKKKEIVEYSSGEMVTIDEILKDDPEALKKLEELRKSMKEHPEIFDNFPEEKKTQGQLKMKQVLEDIRRNKKIMKRIDQISKTKPPYTPEELQMLYSTYINFVHFLYAFRRERLNKDKAYKSKKRISKEYGIKPELFERLLHACRNDRYEGWDFSEETSSDVCEIEETDDFENHLDIHNFHINILDGLEKEVFPLKIKVHRFASKRDIHDFIDKNWDEIKEYLTEKRIKQRKLPREVTDFIWKHREDGAKELEKKLAERYPKYKLIYFEINKVIHEEKKRRKIK
jgi:hypothetical protein